MTRGTTSSTNTEVDRRSEVQAAADRLTQAARSGVPCPPIRHLLTSADLSTGYAIQKQLTEQALAEGRVRSGWKIGITSAAVQAQLGVEQPDFGVLYSDMAFANGSTVPMSRLLQPRIEAEIAFVLARDIDAPVTYASAREAVRTAVAALEIVDSRIAGWDITLVDTVADNASCGLYVLGDDPVAVSDIDLPAVEMKMTDEKRRLVSKGSGTATLGDPFRALLWLAQTVHDVGGQLRAGDVILSGALGPMVPVAMGASFAADLSGLGRVSVTFDPTGNQP
jgi:2-keto-4-pentenoate hydratase